MNIVKERLISSDLICCPVCRGDLKLEETFMKCRVCGKSFGFKGEVPDFFVRWDPDKEGEARLFKEYFLSEMRIKQMVQNEGIKDSFDRKLFNPRESFLIRHRKVLSLGRFIFWGFLGASFLAGRWALFSFSVGITGFLMDFLFIRLILKSQYRLGIGQLFQFLQKNTLHEKDITDHLEGIQREDGEEVAEDRSSTINQILNGLDLDGKKVLFVGCGGEADRDVAGEYQKRGSQIYGLDISAVSLGQFMEIFGAPGCIAEALRLPFKSGSFDHASCTDIVEHVHDPFQFLKENWRILKPGGQMLLVTPNRSRARRSWEIFNPFVVIFSFLGTRIPCLLPDRDLIAWHSNFNFYHTSFSLAEMKALLLSAGFEVEKIEIRAYRGPFKRIRTWFQRIPILNTLNDSIFVVARKPLESSGRPWPSGAIRKITAKGKKLASFFISGFQMGNGLNEKLKLIYLFLRWKVLLYFPFLSGMVRRPSKIEIVFNGKVLRLEIPDDLSFSQVLFEIFVRRDYEVQFPGPPQIIFDVGAQFGLASAYYASLFPEAKIFAFEPASKNFEFLRRNTIELSNVKIFQVGLSSRREKRKLYIFDAGGKNSLLEENCSFETIDTIPLDEFVKAHKLDHIDLLKIDVEGSEGEIFEGCQFLKNIDRMVGELHFRFVNKDRIMGILEKEFLIRLVPSEPDCPTFFALKKTLLSSP